jgi:bifunctional non-homologous end joining protein LigD
MATAPSLADYRRKRDFTATPEPPPLPARRKGRRGAGPPRFVVQEHHATALHWDLRLERDGVLASWAVPRGIPVDPETNHLAVHTEDHPIEYLDFEGDIPEGSYGAGSMRIWDRGVYEVEKWSDREVMFVLHGERVTGRYVLFSTGARDGRDWMIHRIDPPSDPDRRPLPSAEGLEPMVAVRGRLPHGDEWVFEPWWPGRRMLVPFDGGRPVLPADSPRVPELSSLGAALGSLSAVVDGVLVALADDGRLDRSRLERRLSATGAAGRRLVTKVPLTFALVDLVWLEGRSTAALALDERRGLLEAAVSRGPAWVVSPQQPDGDALLAAASATGFGGVVAKRRASGYRAGPSADWVAVKAQDCQP